MNRCAARLPRLLLFILTFLLAASSARGLELTAATLFFCDEKGVVIPAGRWNSGPVDAAWDLFLHEGEPLDPKKGAPGKVRWLNGENNLIRIPLQEGTRTFTFCCDISSPNPVFGLNLFFNGAGDRAGISAMARIDGGGRFAANPGNPTMGFPLTDIPGAGTLVFSGAGTGLWFCDDPGESLKVTLKELRLWPPEAAGLDLVGPHAPGPSGRPDLVGRFAIAVEKEAPRPPEPILWLQTEPGIALGRPDRSAEWKALLGAAGASPPFSFVCGGRPSRDLLPGWKKEKARKALDEDRIAHTILFSDPVTGLQVRWEGVEYRDFPTVEWTLYFRNAGAAETPVLSDLKALDVRLGRRPAEEFLLHHWKGTYVRRDDYEPLRTVLEPGKSLRFAPPGGRPCGQVFPYYNLETRGEGIILVVSWAGQWAAEFRSGADRGLQVTAGQETTRFRLRPGEEVRAPLVVLQFWKGGDWIDAQNVWRRWMVKHNLPRPGGRLPPVPQYAACSSHQFGEMINADEASQILFVDRYLEEGLKLDYWWMDAGWYVNAWGWPHTGTWEVDRKRFPRGLRAISDHARSKGVKSIVWFEPERVAADTWLARNHPEWIIGGGKGGLLDLGNPEARRWLTDHVDRIIRDEGIDLYRQDFNMDPLGSWRSKDGPERQGIAENLHVAGYLAYWDELRRRHPDLLIDTCASGGHRNDLETLRRSVPLLRSDYIFEPVGQQGHTYGLAFWVPFFGTGQSAPDRYDPYTFRSNMCPHNTACFDVRRKDLDYGLIRRLVAQWRRIAPYYLGDYYPLTPYSVEDDSWIAWQFHDPAKGEGAVQAFRRPRSLFFGLRLPLRGLDAAATYEVEDLDAPAAVRVSGRELLEKGLRIAIEERPGAAVAIYRKVK